MAFTLVHANTVAGLTTTGRAITPTCTSTTAGNLLVCTLAIGTTLPGTVSFPGGWSRAVASAGSNDPDCEVWYFPDCTAGITSVAIAWTGNTALAGAQVCEFAGGATTTPLDQTGSIFSATATSLAAATSATTTQANELAVVAYSWDFTSATKVTLAAGSGFTQDGSFNNASKTPFHFAGDHDLDTGSSGVTVTDTVTDGAVSGPGGAAIATFKLPAAAGAAVPDVAMSPMTGA